MKKRARGVHLIVGIGRSKSPGKKSALLCVRWSSHTASCSNGKRISAPNANVSTRSLCAAGRKNNCSGTGGGGGCDLFSSTLTHIEAWAKKVLPDFQFRIAASYILLRHFKLRVPCQPKRRRESGAHLSPLYVCLLALRAESERVALAISCFQRTHSHTHTTHIVLLLLGK